MNQKRKRVRQLYLHLFRINYIINTMLIFHVLECSIATVEESFNSQPDPQVPLPVHINYTL